MNLQLPFRKSFFFTYSPFLLRSWFITKAFQQLAFHFEWMAKNFILLFCRLFKLDNLLTRLIIGIQRLFRSSFPVIKRRYLYGNRKKIYVSSVTQGAAQMQMDGRFNGYVKAIEATVENCCISVCRKKFMADY